MMPQAYGRGIQPTAQENDRNGLAASTQFSTQTSRGDTISCGMTKKRSAQLDQEIREALAQIPKQPHLKTREQLDAEIDAILASGLGAERYEVARALGFQYPKKPPPKKMTLTGVNLSALTEVVVEHGSPEFPNRIERVHVPHIKRTIALGLVEPTSAGTLRLTDTGRDLVKRELEKDLAREERHVPSVGSMVKPELRGEVLARETARYRAKIDRLARALAALS